eukprot:gene17491-20125_t
MLMIRLPFSNFSRVVRTLKSELKEKDELSLLYHPDSGNVIALIGTIHIYEESINLVRKVIRKVRPSVVMIELDIQRFAGMIASRGKWQETLGVMVPKPLTLWPVQELPKANSLFSYYWKSLQPLINYFSEISKEVHKAEELIRKVRNEFDYGGEFRVAYEEGRKVGAQILLGDKVLTSSFVRRFMSAFNSKRAIDNFNTIISDPQTLDEASSAIMKNAKIYVRDLKEGFPDFHEEFIEKRDQHMADAMLSLNGSSQVIVAVVGAAHIFGLESILVNQGGYHLHNKD